MAKAPPNIPHCAGDRVRLRANTARTGVLREINERMWCRCDWDDGKSIPKIVHQYELMLQSIDSSVATEI